MPETDTPTPAWYEDGGTEPLPKWFNPEEHHAGTGGIVETTTGTLLDADGLPVSGPLRAERIAAAEASVAAPAATRTRAAPVAVITPVQE